MAATGYGLGQSCDLKAEGLVESRRAGDAAHPHLEDKLFDRDSLVDKEKCWRLRAGREQNVLECGVFSWGKSWGGVSQIMTGLLKPPPSGKRGEGSKEFR